MTTLTTGALATEALETTLLAGEDLTRRLTLLALDAVQHPEHSPDGLPHWVAPLGCPPMSGKDLMRYQVVVCSEYPDVPHP